MSRLAADTLTLLALARRFLQSLTLGKLLYRRVIRLVMTAINIFWFCMLLLFFRIKERKEKIG